jgi:FtsH-binding integral membrane protein
MVWSKERSLDPTSPEVQAELARRHKAAATTVFGLLVATILLCVIAFLSRSYLDQQPDNPPLDIAVRILVLIFGLGAVVWRRARFSPMRLQDITGLAGVSGLLKTLEKTTVQLALFAAAIALIGFITTLVTGNDLYTYWTAAVAVIVFIYCYPTKASWVRAVQRFTAPIPETPPEPETPVT